MYGCVSTISIASFTEAAARRFPRSDAQHIYPAVITNAIDMVAVRIGKRAAKADR